MCISLVQPVERRDRLNVGDPKSLPSGNGARKITGKKFSNNTAQRGRRHQFSGCRLGKLATTGTTSRDPATARNTSKVFVIHVCLVDKSALVAGASVIEWEPSRSNEKTYVRGERGEGEGRGEREEGRGDRRK